MANGTGDGTVDNKGEIKVIVRTLSICLGLSIIGMFVLVYQDKKIPTELWLLTSNLATAVIAMLTKTSATVSQPPEQTKLAGKTEVPA